VGHSLKSEKTGRKGSILRAFNREFLRTAGYTPLEMRQLGDLGQTRPAKAQQLIRDKTLEALGRKLSRMHLKVKPV
jgi:hypothetical protein